MTRFNILLIGMIALGLFLLPGVISTFTGSHSYVAPENVECQKCHQDVFAELQASQADHVHANANWTNKQIFDCNECHTVSDLGGSPGTGHAARTVDCAICHNKTLFESTGESYYDWAHDSQDEGIYFEYGMYCLDCHYFSDEGLPVFIDEVYENIVLEEAAHNQYFLNAMNDSTLLGGSEACVSCHTNVDFVMTDTLRTYSMNYNSLTGEISRE